MFGPYRLSGVLSRGWERIRGFYLEPQDLFGDFLTLDDGDFKIQAIVWIELLSYLLGPTRFEGQHGLRLKHVPSGAFHGSLSG